MWIRSGIILMSPVATLHDAVKRGDLEALKDLRSTSIDAAAVPPLSFPCSTPQADRARAALVAAAPQVSAGRPRGIETVALRIA